MAGVPGREATILNQIETLCQLDPILRIVPESNLDNIVIKVRHLNCAVDVNAAAERTTVARRGNRQERLDPAADRSWCGGQRAIGALLGWRLRNVVIDGPLPHLRRIDREDYLISAIRAQVAPEQSVGAIDL